MTTEETMTRTWTQAIVDAYYVAVKWGRLDWWRVLLSPCERPGWLGWRWYHPPLAYLNAVWCRARNHPYQVVWFNPNGLEPDMTCEGCGDDLG